MGHLLDAPTPVIVGIAHLPTDFVQDERTIVALLDRETVRVTHTTSDASARGRSGGALESHADVLKLQLPGNSLLYNQLEPIAAILREGSGSGSGVTILRELTARPCYSPTSTQIKACTLIGSTICCYVRGLLRAIFAAGSHRLTHQSGFLLPPLTMCRSGVLAICSESEAPFWDALLSTQMLSYLIERQNDLVQSQSICT